MSAWIETTSAKDQRERLHIPRHILQRVLDFPERFYDVGWASPRRGPNGPRRLYLTGKLGILTNPRDKVIFAVVWSGPSEIEDIEKMWKEGDWIKY